MVFSLPEAVLFYRQELHSKTSLLQVDENSKIKTRAVYPESKVLQKQHQKSLLCCESI